MLNLSLCYKVPRRMLRNQNLQRPGIVIADSARKARGVRKMAASVSEVKSSTANGGSVKYPAIPKIKIKFEGYSEDDKERVKRAKIVRTEVKQPSVSVGSGSKGQCLTCHQCRQSVYTNKGTLELKVDGKPGKLRLKCSKCTRYWCERCLINRYGVVMSSMDPLSWQCPFCKKKCNCSVCRKKEGKLATGIMTHIARNAGYHCVSDFLDEGVDDVAKILQWRSPTAAAGSKPKARSPVEAREKTKKSPERKADKPVAELKVCLKRPSVGGTPPSSRPTKITVMPPRSAGHLYYYKRKDMAALRGDFVPRRVNCVENTRVFVGSGQDEWTQLDHPSYNIFMQERDPFLVRVDQNRSTAGWLRKETVVIDPESESGDSVVPFQASPMPFDYVTLSRSPTPVRPIRERRNPGRYSSNEYDLELLETDSTSSDDNRDIPGRIFKFHSPDRSLRISSSPETAFCTPQQSLLRLKPCRSVSDVNVGYGVPDSLEGLPMEVDYQDLLDGKVKSSRRVKVDDVEKLQQQLASTLKEQLRVAREIIWRAQKDILQNDDSNGQENRGDRRTPEKKVNQEVHRPKEPPLVDDSPAACRAASIPPLPSLPPFHLSLPSHLVSPFLFVSEFLFTFQEKLGLRRRISGEDLCALLAGGRGLGEVYRKLLSMIIVEGSDLWKELKSSSRQRDLEKVAKKHLQESGRNGFLPALESHQSTDESLVILSHLCHKVLEMGSLDEVLEESRVKMDQLQREHRMKEKEKGIAAKEDLMRLYERETTKEAAENRRKEYIGQLEQLRRENKLELYSSCLQLRNEPLGRDRHGRVYWNIQSLSAVVVECNSKNHGQCSDAKSCGVNGNGENSSGVPESTMSKEQDDGSEEDMEVDDGLRIDCPEESAWHIINSKQLLEQVINCLHPKGRREKKLRESLILLRGSLVAS